MISKNAGGSLLSLTSKSLQNVASDARNYSLYVYFGSSGKQFNCEFCKVVEPQYQRVFKTYRNSLGRGGYESAAFRSNPIFFARCDIPECTEAAMQAKLETVPQIIEIAPSKKASPGPEIKSNKFPGIAQGMTPYDISDWIAQQSQVTIMSVPFYEKYSKELLIVFIVAMAASLVPKIYIKRRDPMLWYAAALSVFAIVMSGTIYNAIRGAPFWHYNQEGIMYFYPSAREQFVIEGYIMAAVFIGMGLMIVGLNTVVFWVNNQWYRRTFALLFIAGLTFGFNFVRGIVRRKYGYYPI